MPDPDNMFVVRFNFDPRSTDVPYNSLQLTGEGRLQFGDGVFMLGAVRHSLFGNGAPSSHQFRLQDVFDVSVDGSKVAFSVLQPRPGGIVTMGFAAQDAAQAQRIAAFLPVHQRAVPSPEEIERLAFIKQLQSASPRTPWTHALVAVNVIVFALMVMEGASIGSGDPVMAMRWGSNVGELTLSGQWWRMLTSTFIHFGIIHLALNMLALVQLGRMVEQLFGARRYLVLYLCAALGGSAASLLWHPVVNSAGASGAVFGLFGALLAFLARPENGVPKPVAGAMRSQLVPVLVINLLFGLAHPGIDNAAHVGGLLTGLALGYWLARPFGPGPHA